MTYDVSMENKTLLGSKWAWFLGLGIIFLLLGLVAAANLVTATAVTVYYIGALMIVGGVAHSIHSFRVKGWGNTLFWALAGGLYLVAGVLAFINPVLTSMVLTLMLAVALMAAGIIRTSFGISLRPVAGWGWVVFAGIVTMLAGIVIATGWPVNSLFLLGIFLAVDLIFQGIALISFGVLLRKS